MSETIVGFLAGDPTGERLCPVCQRACDATLICSRCLRSYQDDEKKRPDGSGSQYGTMRWAAERAIRFERRRAAASGKRGRRGS